MRRKRTVPPLLTAATAASILGGHLEVSLDLGLSSVEVSTRKEGVVLPDGSVIAMDDLELIAEQEDSVFFPDGGAIRQVAISGRHFFKLVPTTGAPTLEIDGVRMHRTKGTTPDADALRKVEGLGIGDGRVLDTCTGLGYTALAALEGGCSLVVSIELRPEVLLIAGLNPWSRGLFEDDRVHLLLGDVCSLMGFLQDSFFDVVIHDPPRFAHAGQLYGGEVYTKMSRVLRDGGRLYHYTGEPGSRYRRLNLRRGVMRRLRQAGLGRLRYDEETQGVTGEKVGG